MPSAKNPDDQPATAEIVNLRMARKGKRREDVTAKAAQNRAAFGRGKVERTTIEQERRRAEQHLDGLRRTPADPQA